MKQSQQRSLIVVFGLLGFEASLAQQIPDFLAPMIEEYMAGTEGGSPGAVWQYMYKGEVVFYVPLSQACCDRASRLYDRNGNFICAPDGGLRGGGDGMCPDFFQLRSDGVQIWKDPRRKDPQ